MMRRLCGDTAACVNMRRPFFILRSTDAGVFAPHAPLHHADLPVVRAFSASFPAGIRRSHRASLFLSVACTSSLPCLSQRLFMLPVLPSSFPHCGANDAPRTPPAENQAPTPAARPDATAPPQCRTFARPDSEQLQPAVQFRGSARLLRQKRTCRLHWSPKCFFAPPSPCQGHSIV